TLALLSPTTQQTGNLNTSGTITSGAINGQTISASANFTGGLTVQGVAGVTLGVGSTASGQLVFKNSTNANNTTLSSGTPSGNIAFTLPSTTGSNGQCLQTNGSGVLSFVNCLSGSGGGSGGVTGLNGLSGALSITTTDATNKISVTPSGSNIQLDLPQAINTTSNVTFASLALSSALGVGSGGTGATSLTTNGVLYGAGTGAVQATAVGLTGQCLTGNTGSAPTWGSCGAGVAAIGIIDTNGVGANGATIQSGQLYMQSASATAIGLVNTTTQSFAGVKTFTSGLSISTGATFTNASSSVFTAKTVGDAGSDGNFGGVLDGTTTVNVATTFNVNQITAGRTLTLPSPLPTTAGRIVYLNNIGSASFTMHG
ncbi:hypothetical protein EB077_14375, partial [bacterium]|nr:hypothetical protein [bacterium]